MEFVWAKIHIIIVGWLGIVQQGSSSTMASSGDKEAEPVVVAAPEENGAKEESSEETEPEAEAPEDGAKPEKPRRWLKDRCDGKEAVMAPDKKPCCAIFYTPMLLKCFPDILESNRLMEFLGKTGCVSGNADTPRRLRIRRAIMITALLSTMLGWIFLIVADFAISKTNYNFIETAAFSSGSLHLKLCQHNETCIEETAARFGGADWARYSLGLRAAAVTRHKGAEFDQGYKNTTESFVTSFEDFCDGDLGFLLVEPDKCNQCADASQAMVASILMSTVTYFFTFTTDVLRIWPNYE